MAYWRIKKLTGPLPGPSSVQTLWSLLLEDRDSPAEGTVGYVFTTLDGPTLAGVCDACTAAGAPLGSGEGCPA